MKHTSKKLFHSILTQRQSIIFTFLLVFLFFSQITQAQAYTGSKIADTDGNVPPVTDSSKWFSPNVDSGGHFVIIPTTVPGQSSDGLVEVTLNWNISFISEDGETINYSIIIYGNDSETLGGNDPKGGTGQVKKSYSPGTSINYQLIMNIKEADGSIAGNISTRVGTITVPGSGDTEGGTNGGTTFGTPAVISLHNFSRFQNLGELAAVVIRTLLIAIAILAVGALIYGGYQYISSGGNAEVSQHAKDTITYGIMGLIIAFIAYVIIDFVIGRLTG